MQGDFGGLFIWMNLVLLVGVALAYWKIKTAKKVKKRH